MRGSFVSRHIRPTEKIAQRSDFDGAHATSLPRKLPSDAIDAAFPYERKLNRAAHSAPIRQPRKFSGSLSPETL
jgi:hypothetical protein